MENEHAEPQAPPRPPSAPSEPAQMSEIATIGNIFFEPGRTFEDLKRKPRFILATVIVSLLIGVYGFALAYKVGDEGIRRFVVEQLDKNATTSSMSSEQKATTVDMQMKFSKIGRFLTPVFVAIFIVIGGLLYWAAGKAFGGSGGFFHGWSTYVYSSLPPAVIGTIANFIVLLFKSADEIDLATSQRTLVHANPTLLMDGKASPVLETIIGTLDLFMIWGWVLAAIGLRITNKISSGSAWAIVIIFALVGLAIRVVLAFIGGAPA
jgi:hypothetical protein